MFVVDYISFFLGTFVRPSSKYQDESFNLNISQNLVFTYSLFLLFRYSTLRKSKKSQRKRLLSSFFFFKLSLPGNAQTVFHSSCSSDPDPQRRACVCLCNCLGCYVRSQAILLAMKIHILWLARYCVLLFLAKYFVPLLSCPEAERTEDV